MRNQKQKIHSSLYLVPLTIGALSFWFLKEEQVPTPSAVQHSSTKVMIKATAQERIVEAENLISSAAGKVASINPHTATSAQSYSERIKDRAYLQRTINELYEKYDRMPNSQRDNVEFVYLQNNYFFDHVLGPEHPHKTSFLNNARTMLIHKEKLSQKLLSKEINYSQFRDGMSKILNEYRDENAKLFTPQEFQKFFGAHANSDFASVAGL